MKRALRLILLFLVGIVLVLAIVMFAIGKQYHFEKTITINATPEKIYEKISSTKGINEWNPWMDLDPNLKLSYQGTQGQIGDQYCWVGNENVGEGCQKILELVPNERQKTEMTFKKPFESTATSEVLLKPKGNQTDVTWTLDCDLDYPMNLMSIMMDSQMDDSYGKGLNKLKEISEK